MSGGVAGRLLCEARECFFKSGHLLASFPEVTQRLFPPEIFLFKKIGLFFSSTFHTNIHLYCQIIKRDDDLFPFKTTRLKIMLKTFTVWTF